MEKYGDILTPTQKKVLTLFAHSDLATRFYWTGGTLLSYYYLHHRKSLDLDFFSEKPFSVDPVQRFMEEVRTSIGFRTVRAEKIYNRWEYLCEDPDMLRIDFVHYNGEKKTLHPRQTLDGVLIDSFDDIAANKTMAFLDRNEPKDLFDFYFILTRGRMGARKLLRLVKQKFGVKMSESTLWSESFKAMKRLGELTPLMLEERKEKQEALLAKITNFFESKSYSFLSHTLG